MERKEWNRIEPLTREKAPFSWKKVGKKALIALLCAFLSFIFLFPIVWMVSNSFKDNDTVYAQMGSLLTFLPPTWNPFEWFESYSKLFVEFENFGRSLLNSVIYCSVTIVMVLLVNSLAGYALARFRFPGGKAMTTFILILMIVPVETSVVPTYLILYYLGLLKEPLNVVGYLLPGFVSLMYIYMFRQYFLSMPSEIEEAARLDGCSRVGVYFRMIVPLSAPIFATVGIFTFMGQWNEYLSAQLIMQNEVYYPLQYYLQIVNNANPRDLGMVMAALTLSTIPIALVYVFCQKYIVEGVSFTGLK